MLNEETYIDEKFGKKNPYTVPDGYFEQLTERVMSRLPESSSAPAIETPAATEPAQRPALIRRLRPWLVAACIAGAIVCTTVYLRPGINTSKPNDELADAIYTDSYIDDAADYAMVDNQEIYAYLLADI